jgi:hypothetical protein
MKTTENSYFLYSYFSEVNISFETKSYCFYSSSFSHITDRNQPGLSISPLNFHYEGF